MNPKRRRQIVAVGVLIALAGFGLLLVAALHGDYKACQPGEPLAIEIQGERVYEFCGGLNPVPFLIGGAAALCLGTALQLRAQKWTVG